MANNPEIPEIFKTYPFLNLLHDNAQGTKQADSTSFWQNFLMIYFPGAEQFLYYWGTHPDESLRKADGVIKKYSTSQHTALLIIYIESKRDDVNMKVVEQQAVIAMSLAIEQHRLSGIYALTTIGSKFRFWFMRARDTTLIPLHGYAVGNKWEYIEIRTEAGIKEFEASVNLIKSETPVMEPTTLPSQSGQPQ